MNSLFIYLFINYFKNLIIILYLKKKILQIFLLESILNTKFEPNKIFSTKINSRNYKILIVLKKYSINKYKSHVKLIKDAFNVKLYKIINNITL